MSLLVLWRAARRGMDDDAARYLKDLADALRETTRIQREIQQEFAFLRGTPRATPDPARKPPPSHRGPLNPRHQTWRGFVEDLQKLEDYARREGVRLTKGNICQLGVDTARTITRTMRWYGLESTDWPPSRWDPTEAREGGAGGGNW